MVESRNILRSNAGQGTIEYVLLLVITISMILLALGQIFKPMGDFMKSYMGGYVACMLSSGELPAIHSENKLQDGEPRCSFSFAGTKNGSASGNNGGKSTNGGNEQEGNGSNSSKNAKGNKSKAGGGSESANGGGAGGSGSSTYAGSSSRSSQFGRKSRSADSGGSSSGGDAGKTQYVSNLETKGDRFFRTPSQQRRFSQQSRRVAVYGFTEEMNKKAQRKIQSEARVVANVENEVFSKRQKKSIVKPPPQKVNAVETPDEGIGLGGLFKYILIAIIILLIIILGGGQMFEMSKSYD
ncbi:MAG: hypothetical protein KDD45_10620 [Bdellovibrionales bacterium]|nr:hypothetical protein [Bdellovibrionales bacterium]